MLYVYKDSNYITQKNFKLSLTFIQFRLFFYVIASVYSFYTFDCI